MSRRFCQVVLAVGLAWSPLITLSQGPLLASLNVKPFTDTFQTNGRKFQLFYWWRKDMGEMRNEVIGGGKKRISELKFRILYKEGFNSRERVAV